MNVSSYSINSSSHGDLPRSPRTPTRQVAQELADEGFEFQAPSRLPWSDSWKPISPGSVARRLAKENPEMRVRDSQWSADLPLHSEQDLRELLSLSKRSTEALAQPELGETLLGLRSKRWDFRKASEPDRHLYGCGCYGAYNALTDPLWEGMEIVAVSPKGTLLALESTRQIQELETFIDRSPALGEAATTLRTLEEAGYVYHRGEKLITGYEAWKDPEGVWVGGDCGMVGADRRWLQLSEVSLEDLEGTRTSLKRFRAQATHISHIGTARDTLKMLEFPLKETDFAEREAAWSAILQLRAYGSWPGEARVCYAPQRPNGGFIQGARDDYRVVGAVRLKGESLLDATRRFGDLVQCFQKFDLNDSSPLEAFAWLSTRPPERREELGRELLATMEWTTQARERGLFGHKSARECHREVLQRCLDAGDPIEVREGLVKAVARLADIPMAEPLNPGAVKVSEETVEIGGVRVPRRRTSIVPDAA